MKNIKERIRLSPKKRLAIEITWRALLTIVMFIFVLLAIFDFSRASEVVVKEKMFEALEDTSIAYKNSLINDFDAKFELLDMLSVTLDITEPLDREKLMTALRKTQKIGAFDQVFFINSAGDGVGSVVGDVFLGNRDYFKKALSGKKVISEPMNSLISNKRVAVLAAPCYLNGEIAGVVTGGYDVLNVENVFFKGLYTGDKYGIVINSDGDKIMTHNAPSFVTSDINLFVALKKSTFFDGFSADKLHEKIRAGENGSFVFKMSTGVTQLASYTKTGINNWYILSVDSDKDFHEASHELRWIVTVLFIKLFIVVLVIVATIIFEKRKHDKNIRNANLRYESLLSNIVGGVVITTMDSVPENIRVTFVSDGFTLLTGYTMQDIKRLYDGRFAPMIYPMDYGKAVEEHIEQIKTGNYQLQYRIIKKNGDLLWVMKTGHIVKNELGDLTDQAIITDITDIKTHDAEHKVSEERYRIAIDMSEGAIVEFDCFTRKFTHFDNIGKIIGDNNDKIMSDLNSFDSFSTKETLEYIVKYLCWQKDVDLVISQVESLDSDRCLDFEARLNSKKNESGYVWCRAYLSKLVSGTGEDYKIVGHIVSIDDQKKLAEKLKDEVIRDPLSGLLNKAYAEKAANKLLKEHPKQRHAVMILDIDNFKEVNDTLGHLFGDAVIADCGLRLKSVTRGNDILGRVGGDEFLIVLPNIDSEESAKKRAEEIVTAFKKMYNYQNSKLKTSCSIGMVLSKEGESFKEVFDKADKALYKAKNSGKAKFEVFE